MKGFDAIGNYTLRERWIIYADKYGMAWFFADWQREAAKYERALEKIEVVTW